jgi:hypothetical protein
VLAEDCRGLPAAARLYMTRTSADPLLARRRWRRAHPRRSRAAPQLPDGWGPGWMELTSVADDSLLRKLHGDFPQLCVEGEVGGGGASREVWVTEETDPYFGRGLNESQNASSL